MNRILSAAFVPGKGDVVYTRKAHQYDKGVIVRVSGVALPETYQAHFSNAERDGVGTALTVSGSDIHVPDAYFQTGKYVYIWLYFGHPSTEDGSSEYTIIVPVDERPAVLDINNAFGEITAEMGVEGEDEHTLVFGYRKE